MWVPMRASPLKVIPINILLCRSFTPGRDSGLLDQLPAGLPLERYALVVGAGVGGGGDGASLSGPNPHSQGTLSPREKRVDFLSKFMLYVQ